MFGLSSVVDAILGKPKNDNRNENINDIYVDYDHYNGEHSPFGTLPVGFQRDGYNNNPRVKLDDESNDLTLPKISTTTRKPNQDQKTEKRKDNSESIYNENSNRHKTDDCIDMFCECNDGKDPDEINTDTLPVGFKSNGTGDKRKRATKENPFSALPKGFVPKKTVDNTTEEIIISRYVERGNGVLSDPEVVIKMMSHCYIGNISNHVNRINVFEKIMIKDGYHSPGRENSTYETRIKCVKKDSTVYVYAGDSRKINLDHLHNLKSHMTKFAGTQSNITGIILGDSDDLELHKMYADISNIRIISNSELLSMVYEKMKPEIIEMFECRTSDPMEMYV